MDSMSAARKAALHGGWSFFSFQCEWLRSLCDFLFKIFPSMKFEQEEREKTEDNL
jgi:hypothetical protein